MHIPKYRGLSNSMTASPDLAPVGMGNFLDVPRPWVGRPTPTDL